MAYYTGCNVFNSKGAYADICCLRGSADHLGRSLPEAFQSCLQNATMPLINLAPIYAEWDHDSRTFQWYSFVQLAKMKSHHTRRVKDIDKNWKNPLSFLAFCLERRPPAEFKWLVIAQRSEPKGDDNG